MIEDLTITYVCNGIETTWRMKLQSIEGFGTQLVY